MWHSGQEWLHLELKKFVSTIYMISLGLALHFSTLFSSHIYSIRKSYWILPQVHTEHNYLLSSLLIPSIYNFSQSLLPSPHHLFQDFIANANAKSLQLCPTLCDPIDGSPAGSAVPGILQARILEWVAISFSNAWKRKVKVKSLSRVRLFETPWTAAYQAPLSLDFPGKSTGVWWAHSKMTKWAS